LVTSKLVDISKVQELCRIGAPVDYYGQQDVLSSPLRYQLILVLNSFILDERKRGLRKLASDSGFHIQPRGR